MNNKVNILDDKGRTLLKIKGDRVIVARFSNMTEKMKKVVTEFYVGFTGEDSDKIMEFLNFNACHK